MTFCLLGVNKPKVQKVNTDMTVVDIARGKQQHDKDKTGCSGADQILVHQQLEDSSEV